MNKPKILFVASITGHIKAFHLPYLKWFKENGYETHIATNDAEIVPNVDKAWKVDFERNPFKINNIKAYSQLKKIIDREDFALINCHTPMASVITRLAAKKACKQGTKLIYTAHGFHFYKGAPAKNWILFYPIEKYLTKYTDAIITINTEDYEKIKSVGSPKCKYFLINGIGVNGDRFTPVSNEEKINLRKKHNLPTNDTLLIYAAEFIYRKNHNFLIESVKNNPQEFESIKILFAGKGELEQTMKEKVNQNDLSNTIIFLGYRTDIDEMYKLADYGVSSSYQEGLGLNLVEEMFCGLPVVATIDRGHKEVVDDKINGFLFTINSEKEFINIIRNIKNKTFDYEQMSKKAIEKAQKFEISSSLDAVTKIYKQFL